MGKLELHFTDEETEAEEIKQSSTLKSGFINFTPSYKGDLLPVYIQSELADFRDRSNVYCISFRLAELT